MEGSYLPTARAGGSRGGRRRTNLADILERVLDKGIVIAGDIQINLLDIELLTIKLRLLIASVDKASEMGINWWEGDPSLPVARAPARRTAATREPARAREHKSCESASSGCERAAEARRGVAAVE